MLEGLKSKFKDKFPKAQEISLENWFKTRASLASKVDRIKAEAEDKGEARSELDIILEIAQRDLLRLTVIVEASELLDALRFFAEDAQ